MRVPSEGQDPLPDDTESPEDETSSGDFGLPAPCATTVIAALRTRRFPCAETPLALDGPGCLPASPLVADPV